MNVEVVVGFSVAAVVAVVVVVVAAVAVLVFETAAE